MAFEVICKECKSHWDVGRSYQFPMVEGCFMCSKDLCEKCSKVGYDVYTFCSFKCLENLFPKATDKPGIYNEEK